MMPQRRVSGGEAGVAGGRDRPGQPDRPDRIDTGALGQEVARRRTFAIISHPDAGKTTLTEKLLLSAAAIELAGAVRGRTLQRQVVSPWMESGRQQGCSVTSGALDFEIGSCHVTLLDTPGHQDFSEDTYRTLFAVDSVVMILDAAKGIEAQTRKLFEVCRLRRLPVLTFVNKLDLPGREPRELLDEVERVLGIRAAAINWPMGTGDRFRGIFDLVTSEVRLYDRVRGGGYRSPVHVSHVSHPEVSMLVGDEAQAQLVHDVALLGGAGTPFDRVEYLAGRQTPVFFGSALANFGLEPVLDALQHLAPPPRPRMTDRGLVSPDDDGFSGFVFKIHANMNPRQRDRVAFVRVCSGMFTKDMRLVNSRLGEHVRATRPYRFFGGARQIVERAVAGDVIGLLNPGRFAIGDTLHGGDPVRFPRIPRFPPEHFGRARLRDTRAKQFDAGLRQLEEEGLMQIVFPMGSRRDPILCVVGPLQLGVVEARLCQEYGVDATIDPLGISALRWLRGDPQELSDAAIPSTGVVRAEDREGRPVLLFESDWHLAYCARQNPGLEFVAVG